MYVFMYGLDGCRVLKVSGRRTVLGHLDVAGVDNAARPVTAVVVGCGRSRGDEVRLGVPSVGALCADGRVEVDDEGDGVEGEDEGDDPLEDGGRVSLLLAAEDAEGDDEGELDDDESELYPEGEAEHAVFVVFLAQTLVFRADEYSRDEVASNKESEEQVMQHLVLARLEDRQANKPNSTNNGKYHGQDAQNLFAERDVGDETAVVSQPALREEGEVEKDGR